MYRYSNQVEGITKIFNFKSNHKDQRKIHIFFKKKIRCASQIVDVTKKVYLY